MKATVTFLRHSDIYKHRQHTYDDNNAILHYQQHLDKLKSELVKRMKLNLFLPTKTNRVSPQDVVKAINGKLNNSKGNETSSEEFARLGKIGKY